MHGSFAYNIAALTILIIMVADIHLTYGLTIANYYLKQFHRFFHRTLAGNGNEFGIAILETDRINVV